MVLGLGGNLGVEDIGGGCWGILYIKDVMMDFGVFRRFKIGFGVVGDFCILRIG